MRCNSVSFKRGIILGVWHIWFFMKKNQENKTKNHHTQKKTQNQLFFLQRYQIIFCEKHPQTEKNNSPTNYFDGTILISLSWMCHLLQLWQLTATGKEQVCLFLGTETLAISFSPAQCSTSFWFVSESWKSFKSPCAALWDTKAVAQTRTSHF